MKMVEEWGILRTVQEAVEAFVNGCGPLPEDLTDEELARLASVQHVYQEARRKVRGNPTDGQAVRALTQTAGEMMDAVSWVFDVREANSWAR